MTATNKTTKTPEEKRAAKSAAQRARREAAKKAAAEAAAKKAASRKPAGEKAAREFKHDPRVPAVGTTIRVERSGTPYEVTVEKDGFTFRGKPYRTLSAIAREILGGCTVNGFLFFHLTEKQQAAAKAKADQPAKPAKDEKPATTGRKAKVAPTGVAAEKFAALGTPEGQRAALKAAGIVK